MGKHIGSGSRAISSYGIGRAGSALAVCLGIIASASQAQAQNAAPVPAMTDTQTADIVVTARKRSEALLDTPIAITALTSTALTERNITRLDDVSNAAPNVSFTGGSADKGDTGTGVIFIRGIGQTDYANSIDPGVGIYIDGVYLGRAVGGNLDLPDIAQIEVLRGPQGTLFGKNTMGGAINVTTRRPSFTDAATLSVTAGERGRRDGTADLDLKLSDQFAARVTGVYRSQDGYVTQLNGGPRLGRRNDFIGRSKLEFKDGRFDALFSADLSVLRGSNPKVYRVFDPATTGDALDVVRNNVPAALIADLLDNGRIDGSQPPTPGQPFVPLSAIDGGIGPTRAVSSLSASNDVGPNRNAYNGWGVSLRLEYDLGGATLRSISAGRGYHFADEQQQDGVPARVDFSSDHDRQHQLSQELNLFGTSKSIDWLTGAYFFYEKATTAAETAVAYPIFYISNDYGTRTTSLAAFTEATWRFAPHLSLTAGVRYTHDQKRFNAAAPCLPGMLAPFCTGGYFVPPTSADKGWGSVDPRVSLQYRPVRDTLLYATYSTGFKSGGFNARASTAAEARTPFNPERVRAFEIGGKTALFDRRVTLSAAAYHYNYRAIQFVLSGVDSRGATESLNGNLGDAHVDGFEVEATARVTHRLSLDGAFGYTHAKYSFLDPTVLSLVGSSGNGLITRNTPLPKTPKTTVSVGGQYVMPLASLGSLTARVDYAHIDKQYSEVQAFELTASPAHHNVNARLTYATVSDRFTLAAYVKNLTNERYIVNGFWPGGGTNAAILYVPNEPREIGATATAKF